jgi:hypothetical protein
VPLSLDDAFHRALPVIRRVVIRLYFATRDDVVGLDEDDLLSVAAADLHGALARGGYTGTSPYQYYSFPRGVARRAVLKELNRNRRRIYDYASRCSRPPSARLQCTQDMEFKVFLERLPVLLYRQTRDAIEGSERIDPPERRLSLHVLTRLLSGRPMLAPKILAQTSSWTRRGCASLWTGRRWPCGGSSTPCATSYTTAGSSTIGTTCSDYTSWGRNLTTTKRTTGDRKASPPCEPAAALRERIMKVDTVRLFDKDVSSLIDVFIPVLLCWTPSTLIPELYEVFGTEHLMRFLDLFAVTRFEVPSRDLILTALRDADIYATLAAHKDTVRGLATKYGVEEHQVADAYARVAAIVGVPQGNGNGRVSRPA